MKTALIALSLVAACGTALAQSTPAGLWKTIDDETKQEKSLVRITEAGGVYSGKIEKLSDPTKANAVCEKCTDERKDKPVVGMVILRNIREDKDDKGVFEGGDILDPNNGKVYKAKLKPIDGGKKLEMRGYIGAPMFGRTQTWIRVE
ncbi:DUF2147 domain-containing protein [Ideonella margarita]|jgi:uncharacterized protein (DUF2147 family)|uniref:DUF2147 domain-containing protein n=1 Tax=Ideonella margarita TaxID=2984191 RepID=A0ABU9C0H6_9BURK